MDEKRLDLDAPLISFRRTIRAAGEKVASQPRKSLRLYNSDLKFGQMGIPGAVPFNWEKTPGQPKDSPLSTTTFEENPAVPKLPPGRSVKECGTDWLKRPSLPPESDAEVGTLSSIICSSHCRNDKPHVDDEEKSHSTVCGDEDVDFSDARDAFSMKCSMSAGAGAKDSLRSFTKDPQVKDFMMGRFLPASQAMAEDAPQRTWRKPPRVQVDEGDNFGSQIMRRRRHSLDFQYQSSRAQRYVNEQDDEEAEEYDDDGFFSSKACGLIHRFFLKNSIGPLNPFLGLQGQGRLQPRTRRWTSPQINDLHHVSLGQDEDSWEAVYRYKLSRGYHPHRGDGSKLMTESNQLTSWSDSQMLDGSSFLNSTGAALSPENHEDLKRESGSWKTESSYLYENVYGSYWETTFSPTTERPLFKKKLSFPETPDCMSVSANKPLQTKTMAESAGNSSALEDEFQQIESVVETSEGSSKIAAPGFSSYSGRLDGIEIYDNGFDNNENDDDGLTLKVGILERNDNSLALSLLPPPLPTSPSESWLQRTLPSVSSKAPHQQSYLGIQLHPKNQAHGLQMAATIQ